jgi:group I intron endonuclease
MGYIYILTSPSGKSYIGQTVRTIEERFKEHQKESSHCVAIYNAVQKYGWENIEKDWYICPDEDLNFDEDLLVHELETLAPGGYNLKEGGGNARLSDVTRQKIGKSHIGITHTEGTKQKIKEANIGNTRSKESKKKQSESIKGENNHFYGKKHTEGTKQKQSDLRLGKNQGEKHHSSKKVYQYDLNGTFIHLFASGGEAARYMNKKDATNIRSCARGMVKSALGFKWSYTEQ